ncbi:MAG: ATP-grasp domain-containing protein [Bdellovibrionales bacterium]
MSKKALRVLLICHHSLVPPKNQESMEESAEGKTEFDVYRELLHLGHSVRVVGLDDQITNLRQEVDDFSPHICFNLMEEFNGEAIFDQNIVSYLELLGVPYTGCNPRGLMLCRDKALSKKVMNYHSIPTPKFDVSRRNEKIKPLADLEYPIFVKSLSEEASFGISQQSKVSNFDELSQRVDFIHQKTFSHAICEEFIDGRELYLSIYGNQRLKTTPIWELDFGNLKESHQRIATRKAKWDLNYRDKNGIKSKMAEKLPPKLQKEIAKVCKQAFKALEINSYARFDLRLKADGSFYILEVNPNPNIGKDDEFAKSAEAAGTSYSNLIQNILDLGLRWAHNY